jgi:branched-chain amino acid aminotransferase
MIDPVIAELQSIARKARVFVSMPYVEGLTPRVLATAEKAAVSDCGSGCERRHGIFRMDEALLSPLDHGGLYGDAVFEGILVTNGQLFVFKEHLDRWYCSAKRLGISVPYAEAELAHWILKTVQAVGFSKEENGYLRPVMTRGFGNLGIHPKKCLAPTIYCIASTIRLYPPEKYEVGIELSVARRTRRAGRDVIDPNVKSNNYLNNISGLLETMDEGRLETLMLTPRGNVAEATADNTFAIERRPGWESDPAKVVIHTPSAGYCLVGITRAIIMMEARRAGYTVVEQPDMLPIDMVGPDREAFLTGTGAGLMPIVAVAHVPVGDGSVGPVTKNLLAAIRRDMADPRFGLPIDADESALHEYLARPTLIV